MSDHAKILRQIAGKLFAKNLDDEGVACDLAADVLEQAQTENSQLAGAAIEKPPYKTDLLERIEALETQLDIDVQLSVSRYKRIEQLEAATATLEANLKQAYMDGGCREDEAIEMVGALMVGEKRSCKHFYVEGNDPDSGPGEYCLYCSEPKPKRTDLPLTVPNKEKHSG